MSRFLLALAALAGGLFLGLAPPAGAASPRGGWSSPAVTGDEAGTPVGTLQRPGPITGWAEFDQGIAGVGFTLVEDPALSAEPCSARGRVLPQSAPGGATRVEFAFDAPFPCNRRYQVRATVAPQQGPLGDDTNLVLNLLVDVAIPPAAASGVSAELGDDRMVTVRWSSAPQAPDFAGYRIERAVGEGKFAVVGEVGPVETDFLDHDVPDGGGSLRYRVIAMRPGPSGATVFAEPSSSAVAEVPPKPGAEATGSDSATELDSATRDGSGSRGSTSSTVRRASGSTATRRSPATRRTTATTIDTGYEASLPFDQPPAMASPRDPAVAPPSGDPAVVARIDDYSDDEGRRQTMLLLAGGSTAFSWAMLLRFVTRRALIV